MWDSVSQLTKRVTRGKVELTTVSLGQPTIRFVATGCRRSCKSGLLGAHRRAEAAISGGTLSVVQMRLQCLQQVGPADGFAQDLIHAAVP